MASLSDSNTVVLDYGSRTFKAGYAQSFPSEDEPRVLTPACLSVLDPYALLMQPSSNGPDAPERPGSADLWPVRAGTVVHWDGFEAMLHYILYGALGWAVGDEGSLLLSEPVLTPKADREMMAQLAFEVSFGDVFCGRGLGGYSRCLAYFRRLG